MQVRLESRLQLLTGGARDLPARQQTLRGAMDWSYGLLNPAEQKLFQRLSLFVGGCTMEAVEAVCDTRQDLGLDVFDGMASMVDKSLAQQWEQGTGEPRYVMLKTIRDYGLEHLAASGEEAATRRAHAAYYLVLAEEGAAGGAAEQPEWLGRLEVEHDNLRAALEWLIQSGTPIGACASAPPCFAFGRPESTSPKGATGWAGCCGSPAPRPGTRNGSGHCSSPESWPAIRVIMNQLRA